MKTKPEINNRIKTNNRNKMNATITVEKMRLTAEGTDSKATEAIHIIQIGIKVPVARAITIVYISKPGKTLDIFGYILERIEQKGLP